MLFMALALSLVLALLLTECQSNLADSKTTSNSENSEAVSSLNNKETDSIIADSEDLLADGILTSGLDEDWPPMKFIDDKNNLAGFDIDFANALAEELGVKAEFNNVAWVGVFNGLNAEQYDVIISSTSITQERQNNFNMTIPYIESGNVIVSRTNVDPVTDFIQLNGKRLAVLNETTAEETAENLKNKLILMLKSKCFRTNILY